MFLIKKLSMLSAGLLVFALGLGNSAPLKILVINQCGAYVNTTVINWMSNYLKTVVGPSQGWTMVVPSTVAETRARMQDDSLSTYQVIIFNNNTSIGGVITDANQRLAFQKWTRNGGGIVAWGAFLDHADLWPFVTDSLLGGTKFTDHSPWNSTAGKNAQVRWDTIPTNGDATTNGVTMVRADKAEYATLKAGYPHGQFTYPDEWYSYRSNPRLATPSAVWGGYPRTVDVLMTIDETTYDVPTAVKMGPDHPIAWTYKLPPLTPGGRQGRFIYYSRGHDIGSYDGKSTNAAPNGIDTGMGGIHNWVFQSIIWAAGLSISPPSIPAKPTLIAPFQNATGIPISTALTWGVSSGTAAYRVQLSLDSTFATTLINDSTVTGASRAVGPLANNTAYYWRVNARNDSGTSPWSSIWKFTTEARKPQLVAPTNGKIIPDTTTLIWLSYAPSTSYRAQVAIDSSFSLIVMDDSNLVDTSLSIGSLPRNITYYWRVNASNSGGTSPWSVAWKFKIQSLLPQLVSPAQNAQNVSTSTTLTWLQFADSTIYHVQVAIDSSFVYTVIDDSTLTTTSKATGLLPGSVTYYWHVSARNALDTTAWSATWNFTTSVTGILQKGFSFQSLNLTNGGRIMRFNLPQRANVRIQLFNLKGQRVSQLLDETRDAGYYNLPLSLEAKGAYYLDFRAGDYHRTIPIQP